MLYFIACVAKKIRNGQTDCVGDFFLAAGNPAFYNDGYQPPYKPYFLIDVHRELFPDRKLNPDEYIDFTELTREAVMTMVDHLPNNIAKAEAG
jgi:hypothetical protein